MSRRVGDKDSVQLEGTPGLALVRRPDFRLNTRRLPLSPLPHPPPTVLCLRNRGIKDFGDNYVSFNWRLRISLSGQKPSIHEQGKDSGTTGHTRGREAGRSGSQGGRGVCQLQARHPGSPEPPARTARQRSWLVASGSGSPSARQLLLVVLFCPQTQFCQFGAAQGQTSAAVTLVAWGVRGA